MNSEEEIKRIIEKCRKKNVKVIINNGLNIETNRKSLNISNNFEEIKAALGFYPLEAKKENIELIENEIQFIKKNAKKVIAIGEVGLDLKEDSELEKQIEVFEKFILLSIELDKPIIVHSRKAEKETIELLEKKKAKKVIMHCFSGKRSLVKRVLNNGWFLSIPSSVKYNEYFQENVKIAPISQLFCETDSPFLHPERLPKNEPSNVFESYKKIAEIKNIEIEKIENEIEKNYINLFGNN